MYNLDLVKGDIILRGKYRNRKEVVKTFGNDDKGQPTVNGKRILNFNVEKLLPKKDIKESIKDVLMNILNEISEKNITYGELKIGDRFKSDKNEYHVVVDTKPISTGKVEITSSGEIFRPTTFVQKSNKAVKLVVK